jgi:NAD-dependent dihydropyrimidine dehydrogenase PreA subunit
LSREFIRRSLQKKRIKEGDIIDLFNDRGDVLCIARITERVKPHTVHAYCSSGRYVPIVKGEPSPDKGGRVNILSSKRTQSKLVAGFAPNSTLIDIMKVGGSAVKNYALIVDVEKCTQCYNCVLSCKDEHFGFDFLPITAGCQELEQHWVDMKIPTVEMSHVPARKLASVSILQGQYLVCRRTTVRAHLQPSVEQALFAFGLEARHVPPKAARTHAKQQRCLFMAQAPLVPSCVSFHESHLANLL